MKRQQLVAAALLSGAQASVPSVYLPLNFASGANHKISTNVITPSNTSIEVVFDSGSENFFVFGPHAIHNWGKTCLGCQGQCNATIKTFYDPSLSKTASEPVSFPQVFAYGGFDKIYSGQVSVNDTLTFANDAGQTTTVEDVRFELMEYIQERIGDNGTCTQHLVDLGILGVAPFQTGPTRNTTGPSLKEDLLQRGTISAPVISFWFDEAPAEWNATYTGGAVIGAVDTSKYVGDLVKLPVLNNSRSSQSVGYYVPPPTVSVNGQVFSNATANADRELTSCLLDSGTHDDDIPVAVDTFANPGDEEAFYAALGAGVSPAGHFGWPGPCESIPADLAIDLTFTGLDEAQSVTVKVPLKNYARLTLPEDEKDGWCTLTLQTGGCLLGAPFATASFFAADDERQEIALAQGAISKRGSGPMESKLVARIP